MTHYDTLIVGAGAAGCVLASRLTEDSSHSVLLIEAGPDYSPGDLPADIRYGFGPHGIFTTTHDWGYLARATSQVHEHLVPRGRVVGGSSAINAQVFLRGVPEDFDAWAAAGCEGWAFNDVLPYFRRTESDADYDDDAHGSDGPIYVRRYPPGEWRQDQTAFYEACRSFGMPDCPDHNRPSSTGVGPLPLNNRDRIRQSASLCYLDPARSRPNLTVLSDVRATRILFGKSRAIGIEGVADGRPVSHHSDQVIVSAGAIGTPHLMLLSGLGPADEIDALGIKPIADIPGVGRDLRDHPAVPVLWDLARDVAIDETTHYHQVGLRYTAEGSADANDMIVYATALPGTRQFLARPTVNLARSAGTVGLASCDPKTPPRIDLNYFDHADDRIRMREGIRFLLRLGQSDEMKGVLAGLAEPVAVEAESDADLDAFILAHAATGHHASGTCRMGSWDDPMAVVDPDGCVRGIDNLRIVDA